MRKALIVTAALLILAGCKKTETTITKTQEVTHKSGKTAAEKVEDATTRARKKAEELKHREDAKVQETNDAMNQ